MALLDLTPSQSGYNVRLSSGFIATDVMAGTPRYRSIMTGAPHQVSVAWNTNAAGFTYLKNFYEANKAIAFEINLPLDSKDLTEYSAYFLPGSLQLRSVRGSMYSVQAALEIVLSDDEDFKRILKELQELYPTDLNAIIQLTREAVELWETIC